MYVFILISWYLVINRLKRSNRRVRGMVSLSHIQCALSVQISALGRVHAVAKFMVLSSLRSCVWFRDGFAPQVETQASLSSRQPTAGLTSYHGKTGEAGKAQLGWRSAETALISALELNHMRPFVSFWSHGNESIRVTTSYPSGDVQAEERNLLERWFDYVLRVSRSLPKFLAAPRNA